MSLKDKVTGLFRKYQSRREMKGLCRQSGIVDRLSFYGDVPKVYLVGEYHCEPSHTEFVVELLSRIPAKKLMWEGSPGYFSPSCLIELSEMIARKREARGERLQKEDALIKYCGEKGISLYPFDSEKSHKEACWLMHRIREFTVKEGEQVGEFVQAIVKKGSEETIDYADNQLRETRLGLNQVKEDLIRTNKQREKEMISRLLMEYTPGEVMVTYGGLDHVKDGSLISEGLQKEGIPHCRILLRLGEGGEERAREYLQRRYG